MKTETIDFCKKYKENLHNKEFLKNDNSSFFEEMDKDVVDFYITSKKKSRYNSEAFILKLDEEDLEWLYKKYSKKAEEELQENINELKEKYKL